MRGLLNGTMWIVKEPYEHVNTSFILHYIDSTLVAQRSTYSCVTCIYLIYNLAHHKKWQWICGHNVHSSDSVVKFCVPFYEILQYRKTWRNYFELCTCSYRLSCTMAPKTRDIVNSIRFVSFCRHQIDLLYVHVTSSPTCGNLNFVLQGMGHPIVALGLLILLLQWSSLLFTYWIFYRPA